ncbi:MAG: alpha/beta fold hydrolase [Caldilineaceae bacterium]
MDGAIICIHGAGGGGWEYAKWEPIFTAAGYSVIANDLRPSPAGLAATQFDDYVAQVTNWLPPDEPIILVGASMGGILALKVAERIRPAALVLVNSVPPAGVGAPRIGKQYPPIIPWANGTLAETQSALFDSDAATIRWAWPQWRDEAGAVLNQIAAGIPARPPSCPTLVVLGDQDTDIPYQTGLALAAWAGADVFLYHGMSHVGPLLSQRAAEVAQAILGWLQPRLRSDKLTSPVTN